MSETYGDPNGGRSSRMDRILAELVGQVPEVEAASVVSFDGLAMASALPHDMDEDRVAAMSAALLSLGERAAEGLGRGALSQVFIEGENGTVFLISADDEAVLVAVTSKGAKTGLMLFEVRRAAAAIAEALRVEFAYETAPVVDDAPLASAVPLQVVNPDGYVDSGYDSGGYDGGGYMDAYVEGSLASSDSADSNGSRAWS